MSGQDADASGGSDQSDFVAEFYDHFAPHQDRQDVAFFVDMARESGGPVLEVGCGTGRVLIPTAQAGIEIVGLDYSQAMLSTCRDKLSREPAAVRSRVEVVLGDMRLFDLGTTFSLITMPFRPFQHLISVEDQLSCLASIRSHLVDGGRLILDLLNPDLNRLVDEKSLDEHGFEEPFDMPDGRTVTRRDRTASWDLSNQLQDFEMIYYVVHTDGREERLVRSCPFRYLFRFEAEHLLARSGFKVEDVYADYDKSPYGSKYPGELIFVARKS
jgi:SAM-dependent methyltransferase